MKKPFAIVSTGILLLIIFTASILIMGQDTGVTGEAVGQANLRSNPSVDGELVGEIISGTRYPIIGRSDLYPWVLLADPSSFQPIGWVFNDLITIYGNLNNVPFSNLDINTTSTSVPALPTTTPLAEGSVAPVSPLVTPGAGAAGGSINSTNPTLTLTPTLNAAVTGTVLGEINIRYGPGTDYPPLGRAFEGEVFEVTGYHTQFPWVQIRYENSPNGYGWVATDLLGYQGDRFSLPAITQLNFNLPTLTPTQSVLQSSSPLSGQSVQLSPGFAALGDRIWNVVLEAGFVPETSRFGAIYLQDLQTGEAITFGNNFAFSGTSISKIAILVELFRVLNQPPSISEATDIANTMICSENVATNRLLGIIGGGDQILGAEDTTVFLGELGLTRTFITAPFDTRTSLDIQPTAVPRPIRALTTSADQEKANPNPTNQMTVEEMGWLLNSMYQCAYNESGPLIDRFDGAFTPQECRLMMHVMSNNTVDGLLKAGVPEGIRVAHKHGWINDTHGNAGVFFTPGGDYVLVMMLHQPEWLSFQTESLPLLGEVSRTVYNYYNPDQPLDVVREGYIPGPGECNYTYDNPLVSELASPIFQEILDPSLFYHPPQDSEPSGASSGG